MSAATSMEQAGARDNVPFDEEGNPKCMFCEHMIGDADAKIKLSTW